MPQPFPTLSTTPRPNLKVHWHCCPECLSELSWPALQPRPSKCPYCQTPWIPAVHVRTWLGDFWRENITPHITSLSFYLMLAVATTLIGIAIGQLFFMLGR